MSLSIGIVGLPNVGKSTLFEALTCSRGFAANYPFATIEPNTGVVEVADPRLQKLAAIVHPARIVPATVEFLDIAGLVKGAHDGEGLGNQFLAQIRNTDAICEVVRYFSDPDVTHVAGHPDPLADVETIKTELILADLESLGRILPRLKKEAGRDKTAVERLKLAMRLEAWLNEGHRAAELEMSDEERALSRDFFLLTAKPILYVANVDEDAAPAADAANDRSAASMADIPGTARAVFEIEGTPALPLCAKIESELAELDADEAKEYLAELGINESGLSRLTRAAYDLLGLMSFFTAGEKEVKAWTVRKGAKAPEAAGVIHSDFERGFIRAEVASYDDYVRLGGEAGLKAAGRLRIEGKDYVVQDGDVMHFRFNV